MTAFDINSFNLIPAHAIYLRRKKRLMRVWAVLCSCVFIGALVPVSVAVYRASRGQSSLPNEIATYQKTVESLQTQIAKMKEKVTLLQYDAQVSSQLQSRIPWSKLLSLMVNTSDDTIRFTHINATGDSINTNSPISIQLSGYAKNQSNIRKYIVHLESTGLFDTVTLLKTQRDTMNQMNVVSFQATAVIQPSSSTPSEGVVHEQ